MSPLRVLFAIGSMAVGGAERQVVRYLRGLERSRFAPGLYLIARRGPLLEDLPSDVPIFAIDERVPPSRLYVPGRTSRRQSHDLGRALDEFSADLLVTRTFHETLLAGPALRTRPTPHVAIEASDPRRDFPRQVTRFRSLKKRLIARTYRNAAAVVALSAGAREGLCEFYGLSPDRVTVLPNFVDVEEIDRLGAERGPELDPARFHVVSVGRLSPEKGHDVLLRAAKETLASGRVPNLHVHLIGDGPLRADLERLATAPSLKGRVTFAGYQWNPFAYVARCDLFCLPSRYEGMPGSLLEAMACRIPVVASDCESGPREILAGGEFGTLVPPDDPQALAAAIVSSAAEVENAKCLSAAARKRVEDQYSTPVGIARLEALLLKAVRP